jgi:hypothetical protein
MLLEPCFSTGSSKMMFQESFILSRGFFQELQVLSFIFFNQTKIQPKPNKALQPTPSSTTAILC